jgi:hypothetical protein
VPSVEVGSLSVEAKHVVVSLRGVIRYESTILEFIRVVSRERFGESPSQSQRSPIYLPLKKIFQS